MKISLMLLLFATVAMPSLAFAADLPAGPGTKATLPISGNYTKGVFEKTGDSDWYKVKLEKGNTYALGIDLGAGGADIRLRDPKGKVLGTGSATSGDSDGGLEYTAKASGTYYVDVTGNSLDGSPIQNTIYSVRVTDDCAAGPQTDCTIAAGQTRQRIWAWNGDVDWFRTTLTVGQSYTFKINGPEEPEIAILNAGGDVQALGGSRPVSFVPKKNGTYYVRARNSGGQISGPFKVTDEQALVPGWRRAAAQPPAASHSLSFDHRRRDLAAAPPRWPAPSAAPPAPPAAGRASRRCRAGCAAASGSAASSAGSPPPGTRSPAPCGSWWRRPAPARPARRSRRRPRGRRSRPRSSPASRSIARDEAEVAVEDVLVVVVLDLHHLVAERESRAEALDRGSRRAGSAACCSSRFSDRAPSAPRFIGHSTCTSRTRVEAEAGRDALRPRSAAAWRRRPRGLSQLGRSRSRVAGSRARARASRRG